MDYAFYCPVCKHHNPKLIVNVKSGQYNCWTCHPATKGKTPVSLFKKIDAPLDRIVEMKSYFEGDNTKIDTLKHDKVTLPKEFISLSEQDTSLEYRHAISYLKKRSITLNDILKYNIGYCEEGKYSGRIIIPSYDKDGNLNYFTARSFEKNPYVKYRNPSVSRDIIPNEHLINWNLPIVLCEGLFDAIAIKRNAIPLLGKSIESNLMKRVITSAIDKIYIALDKDALKQALKFCEMLINEGKEVYLVELTSKDPSELGFRNFTKLIQNTIPLTYYGLMEKKLTL
jgi:DNA primase